MIEGNKEVLGIDTLKRLTGANFEYATAYDITRDTVLNGDIAWECHKYSAAYRENCEKLLNKYNDFAKRFENKLSGLEFIGPVVLGDYRTTDAWIVDNNSRNGLPLPIIGANLAVRDAKTAKIELLNRNGWFCRREWLTCRGAMLNPFFRTMNIDTVAGAANWETFLTHALRSRTGR